MGIEDVLAAAFAVWVVTICCCLLLGFDRFARRVIRIVSRAAGRKRRARQKHLPEPLHIRAGFAGAVGHGPNMGELA